MKAVAVNRFGDQPEIMELPVPHPAVGQVQIKVEAASVNPMDWKIADGAFAETHAHHFPLILGFDAAGTVSAVGEGVTRFSVGDRVFGQLLDDPIGYGACAEYIVASEQPKQGILARIPDGLTFATAAALPTAASTALGAVDSVACEAGEKLLIIGATGGVGVFATQIAAARGIHAIATAAPEADTAVREHGAKDTIDYRSRPVGETVADRWPHGLDGVVDLIGDTAAFEAAIEHLRDGRKAVSIAFAATDELQRADRISVSNYIHDDKLNRLTEVGRMAAEGTLTVVTERRVPLSEAVEAFDRNRRGGARGKTIIEMIGG